MNDKIIIYGEHPDEVLNPSKNEKYRRKYPRVFAPLQNEAWNAVKEGRNVALVAPTSSGKTMAIAAPIFEFKKPTVFIYPFRALVLDQTNQLVRIAELFEIKKEEFGTIIGGTSYKEIAEALERKNYILATPDKLISLLQGGREGEKAFLNIIQKFNFVFDEIHVYNSLMRISLVYFIRSVKNWENLRREKANFYFISATFPEDLWQLLKRELEMFEKDKIEGVSFTGNVTLHIKPCKESIWSENENPIVKDIKDLEITNNLVCIFNTAIKAWKIAEGLFGKEEALNKIFVGQDKMAENQRVNNFENFISNKSEALIGSPAIEAGVDFTAKNLVIEETFVDSFEQRFGRAGRKGQDAFVLTYSDVLYKLNSVGELKSEYERMEFLQLIRKNFRMKESKKIFEGVGTYPYYQFWKGQGNIFEREHIKMCEEMKSKGVYSLLAFRGFTPYIKYETGESIGFKSLFRKNLPIRNGKVVGKPDIRKYFYSPRRAPVPADLKNVAIKDKVDGSAVFLGEFAFHLDRARKYWTVLEIASPDSDDNILLRVGEKEYGVFPNGAKNANVRFLEVDA
ncbi:MAG: DEAD/DEAH box helicase [Methanocellales archaeon]